MRVDSGVESGSVIGGQFDSMLAKLIVTGSDRANALERSRRALAEFEVEGMATVLPFDRVIVNDPAFIGDENGFSVHTRWIETEFDNQIEPFVAPDIEAEEEAPRQNVVVEVGGRRPSRCRCRAGSPSKAAARPRRRKPSRASERAARRQR